MSDRGRQEQKLFALRAQLRAGSPVRKLLPAPRSEQRDAGFLKQRDAGLSPRQRTLDFLKAARDYFFRALRIFGRVSFGRSPEGR